MEYNFLKKVVLVTGASAGIGEATALLMAKLGARLALVGTNEKNLNAVAEKCTKFSGEKALPIVADLATDEGCEKTATTTLDQFGRLDVLVNNAAMGGMGTILNADMAVFDKVFRLNVRGVYNLTRLLVPALIESKGNIVNVSGVIATMVSVGSLPYAMTKAALDHFTRLIALELAPKGVRVNTVSPGITISKFHQRATGKTEAQYQDYLKASAECIPLGEVCTPEDIAKTIVHVASEHSRLVTGARIQADGGLQFVNISHVLKQPEH